MRLEEIAKSKIRKIHIFMGKLFMSVAPEDGYSVRTNGMVDVSKNMTLVANHFVSGQLPVNFGRIGGDFLIPLKDDEEGAKVTSTKGFPEIVDGDFTLRYAHISSMNGFPEIVDGNFDIRYTNIINLEHLPRIGGDILIGGTLISSLEGLPKKINGTLNISLTKVHSLIGIADIIEEVDGMIAIFPSAIKSGGLGLLQIKGCHGIISSVGARPPWMEIIHSYIVKDIFTEKDIFGCQTELIDNGFEAYAQL